MSDEIQRYEFSRYSGPIKNDKGDWVRYVDTHPAPSSELVKAADDVCKYFGTSEFPPTAAAMIKLLALRNALDKVKS